VTDAALACRECSPAAAALAAHLAAGGEETGGVEREPDEVRASRSVLVFNGLQAKQGVRKARKAGALPPRA
jgi:hypothetical protein